MGLTGDLSEAQTPYLHSLSYCIKYKCTYSHGEEGGGGWTREKVRGQQFTKLGRKYQHDWLYLQSINSDKHLPQSTFTSQMTTFCFS